MRRNETKYNQQLNAYKTKYFIKRRNELCPRDVMKAYNYGRDDHVLSNAVVEPEDGDV